MFEIDFPDVPGSQTAPVAPVAQAEARLEEATPGQAAAADDCGQLMETIVPRLTEALAEAFKGVHQLASGDRSRLEGIVAELARASREIGAVRDETGSLRQVAETLSQSMQALLIKLPEAEAGLRRQEEARRQLAADLVQLAQTQKHDSSRQAAAVAELTEGLRRLDSGLQDLRGSIDARLAAEAAARIEWCERLDAFASALKTQLDVIGQLQSAFSRLEELHRALEGKLDRQAESINALQSSAQEHARRWGRLYSVLLETGSEAEAFRPVAAAQAA